MFLYLTRVKTATNIFCKDYLLKIKMKNKRLSISIRKTLNKASLRNFLYRFFRSSKINNFDYIIVRTKIISEDMDINLGNKAIVEIKDKESVKFYIDYVSDYYHKNTIVFSDTKFERVEINYIETIKENYDKYIQDLLKKNN